MRKTKLFLSIAITSVIFMSCGNPSTNQTSKAINTVTIGNQAWMVENLNVEKFSNGDPISEAKTEEEWTKAGENKQPAWCYYNNDPANGDKYGKLYNWYAVNDPRGLAPSGWHIPTDAEWKQLTDFTGEDNVNGTETKESGFAGLPGGYRNLDGTFNGIGNDGFWWSSKEYDTSNAWNRPLINDPANDYGYYAIKEFGFSVRCIKD